MSIPGIIKFFKNYFTLRFLMWGTQKDIILIFIPLLGGTGRLNSSGKTEADPEVETWKYDAYWIAHCGLLCMTC